MTGYKYLYNQIWCYLEEGQYENPFDAEEMADHISNEVMYAVVEGYITEEELNKLNNSWDTGIEWSIRTP